ncbi:MAG TPA: winged helix DNA-binding domain-containing protein [Candidatus Dormibacteraeota bacterium]|nr:winged helix DNA-binding domain-containing protein [Candidatus Dormibacteraeota bacterium]
MRATFSTAQRRARLALRHHLAPPAWAPGTAEAAGAVLGLHATDPASVFISAMARIQHPGIAAVEQALYDERSVVRMLGMRRTVFVVPLGLAPVVHVACARSIARRERSRTEGLIEKAGIAADGAAWLREVETATMESLIARGQATSRELTLDVPRLGERLTFVDGKGTATQQGLSWRVLFLLAAEGRAVRGRPLGSWTSTQYRWAPSTAWFPDGLAEPAPESAREDLVRRWLRAFGPATLADLRWWTGWTLGELRPALGGVGAVEVGLPDGTGLALPDDLEPVAEPDPWVALLPALDPTVMGWTERGWYLGEYAPVLFDRSGNAGPTVWADGRIVGGWAQRPDGEIVLRLLEDVGSDVRSAIDAAVETLSGRLGGVRVIPRFRTPLERELSS